MDGELAYWRNLSGLGATASIDDCRNAYLVAQNGGVAESTDSLFAKLFGNELSYWRTTAGLPVAEFQSAKLAAVSGIVSGYGVGGYGVIGYGV